MKKIVFLYNLPHSSPLDQNATETEPIGDVAGAHCNCNHLHHLPFASVAGLTAVAFMYLTTTDIYITIFDLQAVSEGEGKAAHGGDDTLTMHDLALFAV